MGRALKAGRWLAIGIGIGVWSGCGSESQEAAAPPAPPPQAAPAPEAPAKPTLADGAMLFQQRCVTCHGELGDGRGPASAGLDPQPRDFGSAAWQRSVTDQHIELVIVQGGPPNGLSVLMPAHPDLGAGELAALRAHIRSLER